MKPSDLAILWKLLVKGTSYREISESGLTDLSEGALYRHVQQLATKLELSLPKIERRSAEDPRKSLAKEAIRTIVLTNPAVTQRHLHREVNALLRTRGMSEISRSAAWAYLKEIQGEASSSKVLPSEPK